eukprot:12935561-Prorocentrum_lima.AAC.1
MAGEYDSVEVRLSAMSEEPLATFHVERGCTAKEVKNLAGQKLGHPPQSQQLLLQGGYAVEDDAPLAALPSPLSLTNTAARQQ